MKIEIINNKSIAFNENICDFKVIDASEIEKKPLALLKIMVRVKKSFIVVFDISKIKNLNLTLKKYYFIYKYCLKHNIPIGKKTHDTTNLVYVENSNEDEHDKIKAFFHVLLMEDARARYNYIYDRTCEKLDDIFRNKNLCDFKNDSCISQRMNKTKNKTMGCCYSFYYGKDGLPVNTGLCKHLSEKGCKVKCLKCKMFTCRYLRKKGVKFELKDFLLLDTFLNKNQKKYLETAFFKTQDEIIEKWMEESI